MFDCCCGPGFLLFFDPFWTFSEIEELPETLECTFLPPPPAKPCDGPSCISFLFLVSTSLTFTCRSRSGPGMSTLEIFVPFSELDALFERPRLIREPMEKVLLITMAGWLASRSPVKINSCSSDGFVAANTCGIAVSFASASPPLVCLKRS